MERDGHQPPRLHQHSAPRPQPRPCSFISCYGAPVRPQKPGPRRSPPRVVDLVSAGGMDASGRDGQCVACVQ
eukprot:12925578-Prorocentrum_lima.AAC.1